MSVNVQVDDLFIESDMWDVNANSDTTGLRYRLDGTDFQNIVNWQNSIRSRPNFGSFRLEWAFNGEGANPEMWEDDPLTPNGDTLTPAVRNLRGELLLRQPHADAREPRRDQLCGRRARALGESPVGTRPRLHELRPGSDGAAGHLRPHEPELPAGRVRPRDPLLHQRRVATGVGEPDAERRLLLTVPAADPHHPAAGEQPLLQPEDAHRMGRRVQLVLLDSGARGPRRGRSGRRSRRSSRSSTSSRTTS